MPRGPKGEKRRADAIGSAIMIAKIAQARLRTSSRTTARTLPPWRLDVSGARGWDDG